MLRNDGNVVEIDEHNLRESFIRSSANIWVFVIIWVFSILLLILTAAFLSNYFSSPGNFCFALPFVLPVFALLHSFYGTMLIEGNKVAYENFKENYIQDIENIEKEIQEDAKRERKRKSEIFSKHSPQIGHRKPTMKMKDKAWNMTNGHCIKCFTNDKSSNLEFLWVIHPSVELVLICESCASEEEIVKGDMITEKSASRRISTEVQDAVWNRDGGKCVSCGSKENLEFDHIIPFSKGGSNTKRNIQLLCESCNRSKSDNIG